jgi:hypothetical protein
MHMPSRPRGTSGRSSKNQPPVAGSVLEDDNDARQRRAASDASTEESAASSAEITRDSLQRREIPSFSDNREQRIAEAAYWRAERRGFEPGHELDDWLEAEREVDAQGGGQRRSDPSLNQRPDGRTG